LGFWTSCSRRHCQRKWNVLKYGKQTSYTLKNINPPDNVELIKGEIADYWYAPDGILYSYSKNPVRTVKNITENITN